MISTPMQKKARKSAESLEKPGRPSLSWLFRAFKARKSQESAEIGKLFQEKRGKPGHHSWLLQKAWILFIKTKSRKARKARNDCVSVKLSWLFRAFQVRKSQESQDHPKPGSFLLWNPLWVFQFFPTLKPIQLNLI